MHTEKLYYADAYLRTFTATVLDCQPAKNGYKVVLDRTGKLTSQMVFVEGKKHDSLYQMEFGALMLTVCATRVSYDLTEAGGTVDLSYQIEIEQTSAGVIDYHLEIRKK